MAAAETGSATAAAAIEPSKDVCVMPAVTSAIAKVFCEARTTNGSGSFNPCKAFARSL